MKKYSIIRKIALSFILIPALFMSCEIGLGSSVDTEPPAISISNPPADAVISSEFALIGSWSDDGEIESVFVTLRNVETNVKYGAYEAEFTEPEEDEELGSWKCVINPKAAEFNIPDGNYEATVEIQDKGEHITRVIRNFAIDNTPPVIILERPGSVAGSGSMDIYGRNLTLEGMSADDHDVNLLEVYVYESDDYANLLEKISHKNVPPTVSLPVANFEEGVENSYSRIYKSTSILSDSAQTRYCRIVAYDGAIKYPLDGSEPTEEDKKGNSVNYYFLKDSLSTSGILTDNCKITDIYKILTGNKAAPYESFMTTLNGNKVQNGAFVINPKNNPTYTVSVSQPLKKDGADFTNSTNVMYKGSPVTIEVTVGLDNYGMVNVYPYAIECDSYGNPLSGARPIPLGESSGETPVTNYKWTAIISDDVNSAGDRLVNDHCYVVMIEGQDTIGNPVLPKDLAYGFYFDTRANVSIEKLAIKINGGEDVINQRPIYLPANNPANINAASTVEVSGSVISTSGTPQVYINVGDVQAAVVTLTDAEKAPAWDPAANSGKYKYNFTAAFNTSVIPAAYNDKELTLSVKLVNGSASKTETCKIFYDYTAPAIGVYNLTPIARKYDPATETGPCDDIEYLNQTVSFDYSVKNEGNQLAKIVSQVYKKAGESWLELPEYYKEFTSDFENITSESLGTIDTASIVDNSELKIALSVWDKSGNKNLKEVVYTVAQTTDEPAVLPADPEKSTLRIAKTDIKDNNKNPNKKNYIETGMPLSLVAYDDDGIKKVTVEVETLSPVTKEPGNIKEYAFDVTLPTQANPYEVKVTVEDVNGTKNSYSYIFGVRVITTMPIVTLTKNKTVVSTNTAATEKQIVATVNINSDQPDFTVERKVKLGNVEQAAYSKIFDKDYEENQSGTAKKPLTTESPYITDVIDFTSALESGVYTLEYIVTDAAGKSGTASDTFKVDNKAPVIPNIQVFDPLEKKADGKYENRTSYTFKYGNSDSQKTTDGTEVWQSGINNVEYSFDNFATAPLPAAGTDGWQATVDFNSWAEGEHTIYVRATDNVGNVSAVKTANFWFDKSAPTARINSYKDKNGATQNLNQTDGNIFYYGHTFELNITASDTNALQEVKLIQKKQGAATPVEKNILLADISKPVAGLPLKDDGSESDDPAADGTYEYQLYVKDVCGKETLSLKQILTVDHEPPKPAEMVWSNTNKYTPEGTSNIALKGATYQFKATAQDNGASGIKEIEYIISRLEGNPETKTEKIRRTFKADEMSNPLTLILGNSSTDANAELPEGKYEIKVKSTDNAGNVTENNGDIFYVDQKAPEVKANTYNAVGKKALTDAGNTVTITGPLTESNTLASLTVSGGKTPSITHDSTSWTITDTFEADGTDDGAKTYSITAIDIAGNKGTCTATVLIDTVAPKLVTSLVTKPETDWANNKADTEKSSFRFEGKTGNLTDGAADKSSGFKQIYFIFANENDADPENKATEAETNEQKTFTLITRDGTWSSLQSFASYPSVFASNNQGKKYLWIKAYDNAGNSNDWQKIEFIYDIAPPSISAFVNSQEQDNTKQNNNFTLTANATDSWGIASVGLTVNGNAVTPDAAGDGKTWTIAKSQFTDGDYDFIFTAKDKAGKQSTVTRKVTIDATAPEIESVSIAETPVTGIYVSKDLNFVVTPKADVSGIKSVSYTTKDSSTRTTNDWIDMIYQSSSGNYRASVTLEEGENTVYFRIEDNAGNVRGDTDNYKSTPITIDTTPPSNIKIYDATGNEVTAVEIPVKGRDMTGAAVLVYYLTADDIHGIRGMAFGSNQNITEDMTPEASGIGQGKYKVEIPVASQSTGNAYFTVTDKLGNKTNYSSFAFKVDNSVPEVTFTSPAQTQGLNGNIKIEGKVTDHLGAASGSPNDGKVMTIKIEYSKNNTDWFTIDSTEDTITQGLTNTTESFSVEHSFSSYSKLYNAALGETDAATGTLYVRVTATDEAENAGSNTLTINLDRDKDRPTIVFDSVNLKIGEETMSSSDYAWLTGTTVISGTVTDDDGVKELWIKSVDSEGTNSDWKQVNNLNKSGAWNYDIQNFYSSIADAKEKAEKANLPRILEFRVVDNQNIGANEYFTSEESSTLHGIYIKGSDNTLLGESGENTKLYLKVDTLDPSISIDGIHFGEIPAGETVSTVVYDSNFEALTLGGSCRNFQIKFTAKDANGIASKQMTVTFDDGTTATPDGNIVASTVSGETDVYFASFKLDLTATGSQKAIDGKNGKLTIYLQAVDNASNDSERVKEMDYDYKKPTITINRPLENVTLSGAVTVSGILEDNTIQTPSLYYALSTSDTVSPFANEAAANADSAQPVTTWTGIDPSNNTSVNQTNTIKGKTRPISIKPYYKELMSNLTWFLYLDGGATQNHDAQLNEFIQNFGIATYEEINTGDSRFDTIINLYLWIKAVDVNGNEAVVTRRIMADPQGMRPTLVVQSPESEDSANRTITGGTITINGTAEPKGTNVMQYIHVSIDDVEQPVHSTNGSTSWSTKVNAEDGDHTITVWAEDNSGNLSLKTTRYVKVDKYSPEVSSIFFRQRAGNTAAGAITASKEYSSSAYISGQWFLEVTATDQTSGDADGNVETLKLLDSAGNEISGTVVSEQSVNNHIAKRTLQYALTAAAGANTFGELKYKIQVYDGNSTTTKDITVNYDNKNPVLENPATNINTSVVQNNGFYTFGSKVTEASNASANQSGLNFVAFFFKNGTKIYDVMRNNDAVEVKAGEYVIGADGLPWKTYSASKIDDDTITLTAAPSHIYKGGLVKINGVVYMISEVNGNDITISGTLDPEVTITAAEFALAGVVNNTIEESAPQNPTDEEKRSTNPDYFGYYPHPNNDDGDHIIEKVASDGTWQALINSKNIPDGSIDIHYVAFDKAGNYAVGSVTGATVANNQPRIAGAKIYIDYNGNGKFDDKDLHKVTGADGKVTFNKQGEITIYNSRNNTTTSKSVTKKTDTKWYFDPEPADEDKETGFEKLPTTLTIGSETAAAFMMKGKTKIVPEIVGGNGDIMYSYTNEKNSGAMSGSNSTAFMTGSTDNSVGEVTNPIVLAVGDLLKAGESASNSPDKFTFTFTDSTPGTALTASLEIYAGVNLKNAGTPTVKIKPFYWTNLKENSLYIENLSDYEDDVTYEDIFADTKGHIELEADWAAVPAAKKTRLDSKLSDADPKVSGIIKIEGTATDSLRIEKLYFDLPDMTLSIADKLGNAYCLSTVDDDGLIAGRDFNPTTGIGLEITKNEYTQDGHTIEWTLIWDTSKVTGMARLDTAVKVYAQNVGTLVQDASGDGDTSADGATSYKPIVSSAQKQNTPGSTQTATGAETAYYKMDIVPYIKYLDTTLARKKTGHPSVYGRTASGDYPVYFYSTKFSSGSEGETYNFVGFNIPADNIAKTVSNDSASRALEVSFSANGDTVTTLNNVNNNNAPYNKQPNGINNNNLNDDVGVKVWNINSKAKTSSKGSLTEVKMHSNGGTLGYAYIHNGGMTYQLDNKKSNDAISTFENIDFIFDKNGNKVGVYCGTNYNGNDHAGRMKFTISNWNNNNLDRDEVRTNTIDLESMAYWSSANATTSAPRRFGAPKLASTTNTNKNNIYMLYYDTVYDELKFRAGQDVTASGNGSITNLSTGRNDTSLTKVEKKNVNTAKIIKTATSDIVYYSLAVVSGTANDGNDDKVVAVWVENNNLYYAYCANPLNASPTWKILEVEKLSGKADGVCAIAVDPDKHIHIAAYSSEATGSLTYTYLTSYNTLGAAATKVPNANTVYVDRYGTTGEFLTLEFAKNSSSGAYVPYIGYYANEMPKYAYMLGDSVTDAQGKPKAGVSGENGTGEGSFYTGNWEQVILPSISPITANDKNNNINIALTRASGVITTTSGPAGTSNPVLGYAISYQGLGYLETAQLK